MINTSLNKSWSQKPSFKPQPPYLPHSLPLWQLLKVQCIQNQSINAKKNTYKIVNFSTAKNTINNPIIFLFYLCTKSEIAYLLQPLSSYCASSHAIFIRFQKKNNFLQFTVNVNVVVSIQFTTFQSIITVMKYIWKKENRNLC